MPHNHKNVEWIMPEVVANVDQAQLAVLMDIRDELKGIRALLNCSRIPKALDALREVGVDIRRKQRAKRKRAKRPTNGK